MYRKLSKHGFLIAAVTAACLMSTTETWAQKGGKGGGGNNNPPPTGTIYFQRDGGLVMTVRSDGSNPQTLPGAYDGEPSFALHAGQRWFAFFSGGLASTAYLFPDGRERYKPVTRGRRWYRAICLPSHSVRANRCGAMTICQPFGRWI